MIKQCLQALNFNTNLFVTSIFSFVYEYSCNNTTLFLVITIIYYFCTN